MSSKRAIRRKQCKGKQRFETQRAAQSAIGGLRTRTGSREPLTAYKCAWCGGYHFGHTPRRVLSAMGAAR